MSVDSMQIIEVLGSTFNTDKMWSNPVSVFSLILPPDGLLYTQPVGNFRPALLNNVIIDQMQYIPEVLVPLQHGRNGVPIWW